MTNLSSRLAALFSLLALVAAGWAGWVALKTRDELRVASALSVRPALVFQADARPGAGLRLSNQGVGPAVIVSVRMALAAQDGTVTWMGYPDAANSATLNLWEFLGLPDVNQGLPEGVAALAAPPQPGAVFPVGEGADLIRFPAGNVLPEAWKAANMTAADAALAGLMLCVEYQGMDGRRYALDRGGLCARSLTDKDRRYIGVK